MAISDGHVLVKFKGNRAGFYFRHEIGQHVIQRNPPTESKSKKHTSYVSVALLPLKQEHHSKPLPEKDIEIITQTGHGKGGQHQNKTASAVRMKHLPTGISVFINGRDQKTNKIEALSILTARVNDKEKLEKDKEYSDWRKNVLGDGNRGSKIRTYNILESRAVDHRFNIKTSKIKEILDKGNFELLFPEGE